MRRILACLLALTLGACAFGNKHDYSTHIPQLTLQGGKTSAVAVQDERPYVLDEDKNPNFVGLSRGGFGNPFDITTASNQPLAADFRNTIVSALKSKGIDTEAVVTDLGLSRTEAIEALTATGKERALLFVITEWKSDTYANTKLVYNVTLTVYDNSGTELATSNVTGQDNLGGSAWNPPAYAKSAVPAAFQAKLEILLNDPRIATALQ